MPKMQLVHGPKDKPATSTIRTWCSKTSMVLPKLWIHGKSP